MIGTVLAATTLAEAVPAVGAMDYTALMFKMLALLGVVILLGFILIRYVGRVGQARGRSSVQNFEILSWLKLDPKKTVYLVRIGKRTFALGAAESGLNVIAELNADEVE